MESVVEDVEDEGETKGSPANSQSCKDSGGRDRMRIPISANHFDGLSCCSRQYQGHHCRAERIHQKSLKKYLMLRWPDLKSDHNGVVTELLHKFWLMRPLLSFPIHHILKINLIEASR